MATLQTSDDGNFVSTMLISKMHKRENYNFSSKLKYTLMHPNLSKIPYSIISYLIILSNIIVGILLISVLMLVHLSDIILLLLTFIVGYIISNYTIKHFYNKPPVNVSELNTFIVASKVIDQNSKDYNSADDRVAVENKLKHLHDSYKQQVFNLTKAEVKNDHDLKYALKALRNAGSEIDFEVDKSFMKEMNDWVSKTLEDMYLGTRISYWDNKDGKFRLVVTNTKQKREYVEVDNDIISIIDELNLLIFTNHYRDIIEPLFKEILSLSKPLVDLSFYEQYYEKSAIPDEKFSELFRILLSKCLGMQENLKITKRQFDRLNEANTDLKEESKDFHEKSLDQLINQFSINGTMNDLLHDLENMKQILSDITLNLRKVDINAVPKGNYETFEKIFSFYFALEKLRFVSSWFEDIASYSNISGGSLTAIESNGSESIPSDVILRAKDVYKTFNTAGGTVYAVRGVSFDIKQGEFIGLFGPSGSGKTTLLNIMAGLDKPDVGDVFIEGIPIKTLPNRKLTALRRDKMGFVFQFYNLIPVLKNKENVSYPAEVGGSSNAKQASGLLQSVQLSAFENQYPTKLSGGQMQRVTIARSLINTPKILFADEPTGDLDSVTGKEIMDLLAKFNKENKTTVILVTHDKSLLSYCSRVINMTDGKIIS